MFRDLSKPRWSLAEHIYFFTYLCICGGLWIWHSLGLTKRDEWRGLGFFHDKSIWSLDLCPLSDEVNGHVSNPKCQTPGSGLWPEPHSWHSPSLTGGISRTLLWSKLADGATTSLDMKAVAPAHVTAPVTLIQTMSIGIWTEGPELHLLIGTHVLCIHRHTEIALGFCQNKAGRGTIHLPTGGGGGGAVKMKPNPDRGSTKQRGSVTGIYWDCKAQAPVKLQNAWIWNATVSDACVF